MGRFCSVLERAAGGVQIRVEYGHVPWEGEEVGTNHEAEQVEADEDNALQALRRRKREGIHRPRGGGGTLGSG